MAETARVQAEQKAKAEAEAKELAALKAKKVAEAKEKRRIANGQHRAKIEGDIHRNLTELGFDESDVNTFLQALMANRIPHVTINY